MTLDLGNLDRLTQDAVKAFWGNRRLAAEKQQQAGDVDRGSRGSVTGGGNLDGFIVLFRELVTRNGLPPEALHAARRVLTLPGHFRPTKVWDVVVVFEGRLIAAVEMKSQVGSLGNNFNNRVEESVGSAHDFWTAYREGAFGKSPKPFLGWMMLLEDTPAARRPVRNLEPHFPVDPVFEQASYAERYEKCCERLTMEKLYDAACLMLSPPSAAATGEHRLLSEMTSVETLARRFAAHVAGHAPLA